MTTSSKYDGLTKIKFKLQRDNDDYPPFEVEGVWAKNLGSGLFEIDNIPFFIKRIAVGDIVKADQLEDEWWFTEFRQASGHSTLRIIFQDHSKIPIITKWLEQMGCSWEGSHIPSLFSVDVPNEVDWKSVTKFLGEYERLEILEYEEAAINHPEN